MQWSLKPKGICMRCGFKYNLDQLVKEWTGSRVCSDCRDRRPEELRPIPLNKPEGRPRPNASPEPADEFVTPGLDAPTEDDL